MDNNGMSAGEVLALAKDNDNWGNGIGGIVLLFLIIAMMGGGFGGFNNAIGYENLSTSNELQRGFDNQNSMANQREILAAVNAGTMQTTNTTNQVFHDLVGYFGDKYNEITRDIGGLALGQQTMMNNQSDCCCKTLRAIDEVNFQAAQNKNDIITAIREEGAETRAMIQQDKIEALQNRVNQLENQQSLAPIYAQLSDIPKFPRGFMYNAGNNPFCCCQNQTTGGTTTTG